MASPRAAALLALVVTVAGCVVRANLETGYRADATRLRATPLAGGLAVTRFTDARPPRQYHTGGRAFLAYVPLVPYFTIPYERLDESAHRADRGTSSLEEYAYGGSMARAVANDLATAGLFDRVDYVEDAPGEDYRWLLSGTLQETPLEKTISSYGLGMAGVLLWLAPIPYGKTTAAVTLDLVLTERPNGTVVWRHAINGRASRLTSIYYPARTLVYGGQTSFDLTVVPDDAAVDRKSLFGWHFEALRRGMAEAKPSLAAALPAA